MVSLGDSGEKRGNGRPIKRAAQVVLQGMVLSWGRRVEKEVQPLLSEKTIRIHSGTRNEDLQQDNHGLKQKLSFGILGSRPSCMFHIFP